MYHEKGVCMCGDSVNLKKSECMSSLTFFKK